ncbi:YrzE family protein [Mucilaginibacter ginkgonis]|uniref:PhnA-like protein n=1 Tax=Mucilaginibacter ginkgonis TaxID=2682091 RepID=A0A6I4HV40_9SPHI|nr:YrzE family protein [Mucilaginibacter ginkgonis]QQL49992.1 hypothetical protein GO620_000645 [Mucilaginibacter ginkgonis]
METSNNYTASQLSPDGFNDPYSVYNNITSRQRISWPAIFAGLILAVLTQLLLMLLGVAIGMSTVDAVGHDTPGTALALGSGIWSAVSFIISLFVGGWVAGRLAKDKHTSESVIHGLLVAGLMFILTFYLLSSAIGSIVGGAGKMVGNAVSTAAPSLKEAAEQRYSGGNAGEKQMANDSAKISDEVSTHKTEIEEKSRQVADDAASAAGKAALYSFIGVLLGSIAAGFAAKLGRDSKVPYDYNEKQSHMNQAANQKI